MIRRSSGNGTALCGQHSRESSELDSGNPGRGTCYGRGRVLVGTQHATDIDSERPVLRSPPVRRARWVLVARCDAQQAAREAVGRALRTPSSDACLMAASVLWRRIRGLLESGGPLAWDQLVDAAVDANG